MRWFTSDIHFGHRNVIRYCDRPWETISEMDEAIIAQWNSQVAPDDDVIFLGDFGINPTKVFKTEFVGRLNGKKHIIVGNHDKGFNLFNKADPDSSEKHRQVVDKYIEAGWDWVGANMYLTLKNGKKVFMTHIPPDGSEDNRYSQYKVWSNYTDIHIHGHLHGHYRKKTLENGTKLVDVAFDGDLKLLSEDELIEIIDDPRPFIPTRLTDKFKEDDGRLMLRPFEHEVHNKNVRKVVSDCEELVLYNYTDHCTFERNWNDVTKHARGIIFERATGKVVALPFKKFFNIGEQPETFVKNLPTCPYRSFDKPDGSLGIIYNYKDTWRVATRGSFNSDQAQEAQKMLSQYDMTEVPKHYTVLVEIIYPENKIVVNYGDQRMLKLLTCMNVNHQVEASPESVEWVAEITGMPLVDSYDHTIEEMIELQKTLPRDREGFVVVYDNGLRVKIKGEEYLRVHKLISQMSPLSFWESMIDGKVNVDYMEQLPDEFQDEAKRLKTVLESKYYTMLQQVRHCVDEIHRQGIWGSGKNPKFRKKVGLWIKENKPRHPSAFFIIMDGDDEKLDKYIMKQIRPKGNEL